jgi:hypothetical protein
MKIIRFFAILILIANMIVLLFYSNMNSIVTYLIYINSLWFMISFIFEIKNGKHSYKTKIANSGEQEELR